MLRTDMGMIQFDKLLGGLVRHLVDSEFRRSVHDVSSLRQKFGPASGIVGLGLIGGAVAAYERYTKPKGANVPSAVHADAAAPKNSNAVDASIEDGKSIDPSLLLLRTMIAAAASDGEIDTEERNRIFRKFEDIDFDPVERDVLAKELDAPKSIAELTGLKIEPSLREQMYAAALLAVRIDHDKEREFFTRLTIALELDEDSIARWHQLLNVPRF